MSAPFGASQIRKRPSGRFFCARLTTGSGMLLLNSINQASLKLARELQYLLRVCSQQAIR